MSNTDFLRRANNRDRMPAQYAMPGYEARNIRHNSHCRRPDPRTNSTR